MYNFGRAMMAVGYSHAYEQSEDDSLGAIAEGNYIGWENDKGRFERWCDRVCRFASTVEDR